jgi:amino acid transporter
MQNPSPDLSSRLRRDLGTLESYAALIGILIGAGIFQVTSQAWALTGPSVILGYLVLTPAILATSIPYAAYLSTPLGREPGGEYLHISRTLKGLRLASSVRGSKSFRTSARARTSLTPWPVTSSR